MSSSTSSAPSAAATTLESRAGDASGYKGKVLRSWGQLPAEVIRLIATHYLLLVKPTAYIPPLYEYKESWQSRLVYTAFRDALEVEKLMAICMAWSNALEYHPFWYHACSVIDPNEHLAHHAIIQTPAALGSARTPLQRLPPYKHFRNMTNYSCMVCRVNWPHTICGLGNGKRYTWSPYLQNITVCKDHRKGTFCSLCLRQAPHDDSQLNACVSENEDEETWRHVEATCRLCRCDGLWRRACQDPLDREALGGHPLKWRQAPDWEIAQAVETFVEMGEGCVADVLCLAREKHWLRSNTKIAELLSQALASTRFNARADAVYDGEGSDDDLSGDDEEDAELMSLTEDAGGIRELAISDWARNRILDGHWIAPADQWFGLTVPQQPAVVAAQHPCPWHGAAYSGALVDGESAGDGEELEHPRPRTYKAPCPPTYTLCEHVYRVYQRVLREILLPAMSNIVRRILMESQADGTDPAQRACRMSLEEVVKELQDHATWSKGVDWLERRVAREREARQRRQRSIDDDSSTSSRSDGSHTTSPVLSTTTLQTTPSPPPSSVKDDEAEQSPIVVSSPSVPAIQVPEPPPIQPYDLLRPVPYVPVTVAHLPQYSTESLKMVWREACAPLYQCRCSICERAMLAANIDSRKPVKTDISDRRHSQDISPVATQPQSNQLVIRIEDPPAALPEEEEEEDDLDAGADADFDADADADFDDDDDEIESEQDDTIEDIQPSIRLVQFKAAGTLSPPRLRTPKRSLEEMSEAATQSGGVGEKPVREGSPPKRARLESESPARTPSPSPIRLRKRSSEELEDDAPTTQSGKRVKT